MILFEIKRLLKDRKGIGTIEIVLILVVLIGLVLIFKNQITGILNSIFGEISDQVTEIY